MLVKKLGLVLAGGGGRGAYQLGVWKYLQEIGLDKNISVISGTSVGALNGTIFICSELERAEHIWTHGLKEKLMPALSADNAPSNFGTKSLPHKFLDKTRHFAQVAKDGICSRESLCQLIEENIDWEKLRATSVHLYATCCKLPFFSVEHFLVNDKTLVDMPTHAKKILCATSALPGLFAPERIAGEKYIDGGFMYIDNVPCRPAETLDTCTDVLVIRLDKVALAKQIKSQSDNINYTTIVPSKDLGGIRDGIMDFSEEGARWRMSLGYADCKKIYSNALDTLAVRMR